MHLGFATISIYISIESFSYIFIRISNIVKNKMVTSNLNAYVLLIMLKINLY